MDKPNFITKSELANKYGVSSKTLSRWLKRIGYDTGRKKVLSTIDIDIIYNRIGKP